MGLISSFGKRPSRLHSSIMGIRLSSMNLRVLSRTRRSSSLSNVSSSMKSTPLNLMAMPPLAGGRFAGGQTLEVIRQQRAWSNLKLPLMAGLSRLTQAPRWPTIRLDPDDGRCAMTSNPDEPIWGELGIEFVVQLLLFLYPYGAAQMRVPYNFWVGVGCRVFATAIAIRMFWIFPPWAQKLTRLKKALISLVAVGIFIVAFSSPATNAYYKVNQTHGIEVVVPPSTQLVTDSPAVAQYLKPVRPTSLVPALPLPTPTAPNDILIGSITPKLCAHF